MRLSEKTKFEVAIEKSTGRTIEYLRDTPIDAQRNNLENIANTMMRFISYFPLVGRGNVLRDRVITHEEAEKRFRKAIR